MPFPIDVSQYAYTQANGDLIEYIDTDAVNNALQLWLASKKGEYLRNPSEGGALDSFQFKTMRPESINTLKFNLINAINNYFNPAINVDSVAIVPLYEERAIEVNITYTIISSGVVASATIYINTGYSYQKFTYEDITYTEENLLEFVKVKKPDMVGKLLLYDEEGFWKWNTYKLVNFTNADPYFDEIFAICNGD